MLYQTILRGNWYSMHIISIVNLDGFMLEMHNNNEHRDSILSCDHILVLIMIYCLIKYENKPWV